MRLRLAAAVLMAQSLCATAALGGDITSGSLQIQGVSLEVDTLAVTTGIDIPTTIQTKFGGKVNDAAPLVEGLIAVAELTGPGLDSPIQLKTAPGYRFQIPGFKTEGIYYLQNVRLMKGADFVAPATPSAAAITVANVLQTSVKVHQLSPDELRARGIVVDGRNFNVYEYSFTFLVDGKSIEIPFPVIVDPRTHEVSPIGKETPFSLPPVNGVKPPRWSPPDVVTFDLPPDADHQGDGSNATAPGESKRSGKRASIPAAIVIPNSLAVLHQFFAVILTVSNGAPSGSTARVDDIRATIKVPAALRTAKTNPSVAFGQAVPIVDPTTGVTFLVAQSKGEAEWDLEGLQPGTHTVDIEVRATLRENGQDDVPLKATPRASIVVQDPRFNITFSHPDTVRKGIGYSTYSFITNLSGVTQTMHVTNGVASCDQTAGANVCRVGGADSDEITLASGEMKMVEYKLRPGVTGHVFATAGSIDGGDTITAAVQLHMGVSETGIPLSPTTLVMPYYAQFLPSALLNANLQLLGLGYSLATAPVSQTTAKLPRVIRSDVFFRAVDIARAGQRVFITDNNADARRDTLANLSLDMLGNSVQLDEWDSLRRTEKSGRVAGASIVAELNAAGMTGRSSIGEFVDLFGSATSYRTPYVLAIAHGTAASTIALHGASGRRAAIANEAASGWIRDLSFADVSQFDVPSLNRVGQIALAGRWTEDLEVDVTPSVTGAVALEIIFPGANDGVALRAHLDLNGTAGQTLRVPLTRGASSINALLPNGGINTTAAVTTIVPVPLQAVAARQDLNLDPEGHKVSVLFNRPVTLPTNGDWRSRFAAQIAFNRDGVAYHGNRAIFAAALQEDGRIVNLAFDSVLTTNANYTLAINPIVDPVTNTPVSIALPLQPKIDNTRPSGIVYGKFLKGDNTPIAAAEVRLYTGHFRGCQVGIMDDEPPVDCNPYQEAPQYGHTEPDGTFLFEYIPRDPIADSALNGGYRLLGVSSNGRFTIVDGAVRLPGRVSFVNLQLLGRGAAEGVVRYENGQVVAGADVFVGSTMFNIGRTAKSDGNGFFHVEDLPVGPITFTATDANGNVAYAAGEIATPGQLLTRQLQIIRKPFPPTATVFGVVRRSDTNAPVVAARVGVYSQGYGLSETLTDADGRFEFRKVPSGFVTVLAAEWSVSRQSAAIDFDLHADETHEANLTLSVTSPNDALTTLSGDVLRENPLFPGDPSKYERVSGAIVKLGGRPMTADANGHFAFDSLPVAWNSLNLTITAYEPSTKRIGSIQIPTLTESGPNNVSIFIAANSFGTGVIRVRLLSANGQPASGFRVIQPGFPPTPFRSLGAGLYELTQSVGGAIDIWAVGGPPDYGDQYAHDSARLEFPGQITTVTMRLPGQGSVRAKLHGDFDVIGDITLGYQAWDESEQMPQPKFPAPTASTSENGVAGYATFTKVPALKGYTVESNHPSYGYASATGTLAYDGDVGTHVLQLSKLSTIRGTVYAIDGKTPIAGAAVRLDDGRRDTGVTVTQPDGTFMYTDVPADVRFSVVAGATQSGIYRTGVAYGKTPPTGGPVDGVSVILRRRGSVDGRVVYIGYKRFDPNNPSNNVADDTPNDLSDNAPVPLAKLWMKELDFPQRSFGSDADPLTADVAGRFALSSVFVGTLHARAWDSGNQDLRGDWNGSIAEEGQPVTAYIGIGAGGTGSVQVTITDPNQSNAPVVNAEVGLYRAGLFDLTSSGANGVATFQQVPVGSYSISAYSKALGKSGSSTSFTVDKDLVTQLRVLLEFSGKVDGALSDPEAPAPNGLPGVAVTLTGSSYQTRASTNTAGAFTFDGVREGLFTLDARDTQSNRRATATHTLSAADPHPIVNLELERTDTLYVSVYLPDDSGAISSTLAGPVSIAVDQRSGDFARSMQGNPIVMPKLFASEPYSITVHEIGGGQRQLTFRGTFPKGSAADPVKLVYPAFGSVDVIVTQGGAPANGARVSVSGGGRAATLFTDAAGRVTATGIGLGAISAQAVSVDGGFSGSASGQLLRTSVPATLRIDLGTFAGVTGLVLAEAGGPSVGTRVLAAFSGCTLEVLTDTTGRYTFNGIATTVAGTAVTLRYIGTDDVTIGARQTVTLGNDTASKIIALPAVKLDATSPQIVSISPADGAQNVSPDSRIRIVFSEPIRADQVSNTYLQLVPADGTGQVTAIFDPPVTANDGTFAVTMRPPPAPPAQRFPLKSNTLYRVIVSGTIEDLTGHRLPSPLGTTFTTSDYTEPHVIKTIPAVTSPVSEQITFQFQFNEPVDPAPWLPGGGATFHFYKLSGPGTSGQIVAEKAGHASIDPATSLILYFAPNDPIEAESFYRVVFSGIRDMQGNALAEQTFHFFSFDKTRPFVRLGSPVPDGFPLISGVEYTLGVDLRNATADGTAATDVATVDYLRVDGATETYLTTMRAAPFAYHFVAPEAPEAGMAYSLRAKATDGSGNVSEPATITWTVKPNAPPKNLAITFTPAGAYPANSVVAKVTFDDEGTFATVVVALNATKQNGSAYTATQTKQVTRATVGDAWPSAQISFALPSDLNPATPATFSATVTDVRGLATTSTATLPLLTDTGKPSILAVTPAAETVYHLNDKYTVEATVTDAETAVAQVDFTIDSQTYHVTAATNGKFISPQITVPAKNIDTRVSIVVAAKDYQGNRATKTFEVVYVGVNDPTAPKASWLCPIDRGVIPAAQTSFSLPLRVHATDDIAVTSVKFRVPGVTNPIDATRVGTTDDYTATAVISTTPDAGSDFVLTAIVSDADPSHTIEVPIASDVVAIDKLVDATQSIGADNVADFDNKSVLIRGAAGRLVLHVPATLRNLIVLDGARVDTVATTTTLEQKVDITIVDRLYADCASSIDVTAKGYLGGWGANADGSNTRNESATGRTAGNTTTGGAVDSGASHGGLGTVSETGSTNSVYDAISDPMQLGSGGAGWTNFTPGGSGGGAISIRTSGATDAVARVVIAGNVRADGAGGAGILGAGSGGSIRVNARQLIIGGAAHISTNGGDSSPSSGLGTAGPAGGGGRIAVIASERLDVPNVLSQFESRGGDTPSTSRLLGAGAGTIYVRRPGESRGEVYVGNATASRAVRSTPFGFVRSGVATTVTTNTLTDSSRTFSAAAVGEGVLLTMDPSNIVTITGVSSDGHTLTVDGALAPAAGAPYRGVIRSDRLEIGANALARFDESVAVNGALDSSSSVVKDSNAAMVLYSDRPLLTVSTTPVAGGNVIRGTNLDVSLNASSPAGLVSDAVNFSAVAPILDPIAGFPTSVTAHHVLVPVGSTAMLGPAALNVRVIDRADRATDAPVANFTVVDNQPPSLDAFTTIPDTLYPGKSVVATINASDDVAITKLTLTSQIGTGAPAIQSTTPNAKSAAQTATITVPITTPGNTAMTIEAAVEDNYAGRTATKQTKSITILKDVSAPGVSIAAPTANQLFNEGSGTPITILANAIDAEVGVKTITVTVGETAPIAMTATATPNQFRADVPVPNVDGVDNVSIPIVVTAADYEGNAGASNMAILVKPLIDPNAPSLSWTCGTSGAMYPAGYAAKLRVFAKGATPANSVQKVEFFPNNSPTAILATAVAGVTDQYEATYTIPALADGTTIPVRAVATAISGSASDLTTRITVIADFVTPIVANMTIDATNAATYDAKTVVVQGGTVTIAGAHTFDRLLVLNGATLTHATGGASKLDLTVTRNAFIACGGAIDASGAGFIQGQTNTGATAATGGSAGSHLGIGGRNTNTTAGSTFGSVGRPAEPGGGGAGAGGGAVRLGAATIINDGAIRANGANNPGGCNGSGGGAGGSVWLAGQASGTGRVETVGGNGSTNGGGGAISIDTTSALVPWLLTARSGNGSCNGVIQGGAGTVLVRTVSSTYGDLTIDDEGINFGTTDLPSLGSGVAQTGTSGATLVTDRTADIPAFFAGHWIEITAGGGALKGSWRIGSINAKSVTLTPNGGEAIDVVPGDRWQGVYHFDTIRTPNGDTFRSADPIRLAVNGVVSLTGPSTAGKFLTLGDSISATTVTVKGNVSVLAISAVDVTVRSGAVLAPPSTIPPQPLTMTLTGALTVESGGSIDATACGYEANQTNPGATVGSAGASHLGVGGSNGTFGSTFGSIEQPREFGAGSTGPAGGGAIRITAATIANNGAIRANGKDGDCGTASGAGGSVWIAATTLSGTGRVEASGGSAALNGGGGAIAVETSGGTIPWTLSARTGVGSCNGVLFGGAGTIFARTSASTFGSITIDNETRSGASTDLPALGRGIAQAGTSGATLVTDRAVDIPAYSLGRWIDVTTAAGVAKGTWRIASINAKTVTLTPNATGSISLDPSDRWQGVYRFDSLKLRTTRLTTQDRLLLGTSADLDGASTILGNNSGSPLVDATKIALQSAPTGASVVGIQGAVADTDTPITMIATNSRSGASFTAVAAANGSFVVSVQGNAGDTITLKARDANLYPLESTAINVGTLAGDTPVASQIAKSSWTSDTNFRAQRLALDGTILGASNTAAYSAAQTDKLVILDVSDPSRPALVRTVSAINNIRDFKIIGGWAYVAGDRFATLDLNSTISTVKLTSTVPAGTQEAVAVSGGYAFTSENWNSDGRVHVYDVSVPAAPRYLSEQVPGVAQSTIYSDLIAYGSSYLIGISNGASGWDVTVIDRRDVNALTRVGGIQIPNFVAWRGHMRGSLLYLVGTTSTEMVVVDLANPSQPIIAGRLPLPAAAGGIRALEDTTLIAATTAGAVATSVDPAHLQIGGAATTGGNALDVAATGGFAYVANEAGIAVVPVAVAPIIDASRISLSLAGTMLSVTGSLRSVTGQGAINVEVRDVATAASVSIPLAADGSFSASIPATGGDAITVTAADAQSRVSGPISVGTAPFASSTKFIPIAIPGDPDFRARGVKILGNTAVVSSYPAYNLKSNNIVLFDISNPPAPVQTRIVPTVNNVRDVEIAGGWAYITGDRLGLLDLSSPTSNIVLTSVVPAGTQDAVAVSGGYAFTAENWNSDGRIHVYDVTNPLAPRYISEQVPGVAQSTVFTDLIAYGNYLIGISNGASGWDVTMIDRRDVNLLKRVGGLQIPQVTAFRGRLVGTTLYLAGQDGGVAVVDVSDPTNPRLVSSPINTPGQAYGIDVSGSTVMAADRSVGVSFLDNTTALRLTGTQTVGGDAWDVALGGANLYVANELGLAVVQNVTAPPEISASLIAVRADGTVAGQPAAITGQAPITVEVKNAATSNSASATVASNGSFSVGVAAAAGDTMTVKATDALGRTAGPILAGSVPFGSAAKTIPIVIPGDPNFRARAVKVEGTTAVLASYPAYNTNSNNIVVFDTTNPVAPLQTRIVPAVNRIRDIELSGGWLYVTGDRVGTLDLRSATSTINLTSAVPAGTEDAIVVAGGYAFASEDWNSDGRIHVYDVTNPAAPRYLSEQVPGVAQDTIYSDLIAYGTNYLIGISNGGSGWDVTIIDRRDVNAMTRAGGLQIPQIVGFRGRLVGTTLYVAGQEGGVATVDVSDPANPRLLSTLDTAGQAYGVDVSGATVMVADRAIGVTFLDNTTTLRQTGTQFVGGDSWDVALGGTTLYIANEQGLALVQDVVAPPDVVPSLITTSATTTTTATITGSARSVVGRSPAQVTITAAGGGTSSVAVSANGTFTATVAARNGEALSIRATDALGRTSTKPVGSVPFFTVVSDQRGTRDDDANYFTRRISVEGPTIATANGTQSGVRPPGSSKMMLFRQPNASDPPAIATVEMADGAVNDLELRTGFAYVAGDRFAVVDTTSTTPARYLTSNVPPGRDYAVVLSGTYAYTAEGDWSRNGGLRIYDVTTPSAPSYLNTAALLPGSNVDFRDLILSGTLIYAISPDTNHDITVIDISTAAAPTLVAQFDVPNFKPFAGAIDGPTLYLAGGSGGVAIIDITTPATPVLRSVIRTNGLALALARSSTDEIVVADGSAGLTFIDTSDKVHPVILGSQLLAGSATDVKVTGGQLYVATQTRYFVLKRP